MAYENLCMYCFKELGGESVCPHCGGDSRAAVPQVQLLPGTLVHNERFLIGRALGQDSGGIVYNALDTKRGNPIRIREYLPRNCAQRLNDGGVVPMAGMEDAFETGMRKLRASVDSVEDPRQRHFYFEENGTAYIAQRKNAATPAPRAGEFDGEEEAADRRKQFVLYAAIAGAVVLAVAIVAMLIFSSLGPSNDRTQPQPLSTTSADASWAPDFTPTPTPYATPTFAALVDPELSWMDYTLPESEEDPQPGAATQRPTVQGNQDYPTVNNDSSERSVRELQERLVRLGWLSYSGVTGKYDTATKSAVREFQRYVNEHCSPAEKLAEDGIAGKKTQQWLYNASVSLYRPTATPTPKVTARPNDGSVDKNSSKSAIRKLQNKLITLGLMPEGSADGSFGSATQAAVKSFQKRVNQLQGYSVLPTNGAADALTCAWLDYYVEEWTNRPTATPKPKATATPKPAATNPNVDATSSKETIQRVQKLLRQVGLLSASDADGVYGVRTAEAVRKFQLWINELRGEDTLDATGAVDPLTLRYLEYCVENGRVYDLPTNAPATEEPSFEPDPTEEPAEPEVTEVPPEQQAGGEGITPESPEESIEFMQEMLSEIGLLSASQITGSFDADTTAALIAFQQCVNQIRGEGTLAVSGECDTDTLNYLQQAYDDGWKLSAASGDFAPTEAPTDKPTKAPTKAPKIDGVAPGSSAKTIRRMQKMLNTVKLLSSKQVNGKYTEATEEAVRALQRAVNAYNGKKVLKVTGMCDSNTLNYLSLAAERGMDLRKLAGTSKATKKPAATAAPGFTDAPTAPVEPEETAVPSTPGTIKALHFAVSGREVSDLVELTPGDHNITWGAEGDVQSYYVYLYDGSQNLMESDENTERNGFPMSTSSMRPGEVYELRVGALPVNGAEDDIFWQSLRLTLPVEETPEPTEEPTPEPTRVPEVSAPVIRIGGSVYQVDGVQYISDSTAIFSWMSDGQVAAYSVNLVYQGDGTSYELGVSSDTSKTVNVDQLQPGLYTLHVGAIAEGLGEDSAVWSELSFGIPEPEPEITQAPEVDSSGDTGAIEGERLTRIDADSAADDIQTVQMALYSFGLLDVQLVQPGVLDRGTLEAVAAFQQKVIDTFGAELTVIDPEVDAAIDEQTLDLLLYQNLSFPAQE